MSAIYRNNIIRPMNMPGQQPTAKPRAEKYTGTFSQKKKLALVEEQFLMRWNGRPFETEHRFHPTRKWRWDYAWPTHKVALEIEGGIFNRGAHVRPRGIADDIDKQNAAMEHGWQIFRLCDLNDVDVVICQLKYAIRTRNQTAAAGGR